MFLFCEQNWSGHKEIKLILGKLVKNQKKYSMTKMTGVKNTHISLQIEWTFITQYFYEWILFKVKKKMCGLFFYKIYVYFKYYLLVIVFFV